ncbi:MAG: tetratricopeptide repeat protein, partial [Nitrospirota bacterium]
IINHLKGNTKEAAEYFERALEINPRYTQASLNLAIAYNDMGEFKQAQEVFSKAAQIAHPTPTSIDPFAAGKLANEHYKLGSLYFDLGLFDDAIEEYSKALKLHPRLADGHTKIGMALRSKGRHEEAITHFKTAKEINPAYGQAWVQLGLTYYTKGLTALAFEEWEAVLKQNPDLKEAKTYIQLLKKKEQ